MFIFVFMKIEDFIAQLLYRYQCVTVPNFGAFLTEIESARINEIENRFHAPSKRISFNSYLKNNDGLLANHIAKVSQISYDDALVVIKNQVQVWNEKLELFGGITIKNIGDFVLNNENKLVFTPNNKTNFLITSFGLNVISSDAIFRELNGKTELLQDKSSQIIPINVSRNRTNYLKYVAVFALGFGILGYAGYQYNENLIAQKTLAVQKNVQKKVTQKIQEATFVLSFSKNCDELVALKKSFHLVAGAFREEKNAKKQLQILMNQGFEAQILPLNKSNLYPVVYASFSSFAQADSLKTEIKKRKNPDTWILIQD